MTSAERHRPVCTSGSGGAWRGCRSSARVPWTLASAAGGRSGTTFRSDMGASWVSLVGARRQAQPLGGPDQVGVGSDHGPVVLVDLVPAGIDRGGVGAGPEVGTSQVPE